MIDYLNYGKQVQSIVKEPQNKPNIKIIFLHAKEIIQNQQWKTVCIGGLVKPNGKT